MKKLMFALFVVLTTSVVFTSCKDDEELTDSELYTIVLNNGTYSDGQEADLDVVVFVGTTATYTWQGDIMTTGSWNVVGGKVVITDSTDGTVTNLTITEEGDKLTASDGTILVKQ